jgi:RNA polymerase sigma factor (sigma-70 family)
MSESEATVYIVDDDPAVREGLAELMDSVRLTAQVFGSAQEFLDAYDPSRPGCLVLDVRLPGMSGLRLQDEMIARNFKVPIVFISGHGDLPMAVGAMKKGAYDFLEKPVGDQVLLDVVNAALSEDRKRQQMHVAAAALEEKLATLTAREREVFDLLKVGKPTRAIAKQLGISQKTAQAHRMRVLEKLGVDSADALIALLHHCGLA